MDFTVILQPLLDKLWFPVPLFLLVAVLKSAPLKGWMGEATVNLSAHFLLDRKTYHLCGAGRLSLWAEAAATRWLDDKPLFFSGVLAFSIFYWTVLISQTVTGHRKVFRLLRLRPLKNQLALEKEQQARQGALSVELLLS